MADKNKSVNFEQLLSERNIRPTPARILILKEIYNSRRPLSAHDIEEAVKTLDRSSITRALPILNKAHLIHQISDGSGSMKYELCKDNADIRHHSDFHAHFYCRVCGKTTCITDYTVDFPSLPEGYYSENLIFTITGICPDCN